MGVYVSREEVLNQKNIAESVRQHFEIMGVTPRVYIQTFGCQQNESDSEKLYGLARLCGYVKADSEKNADLIIVNTCAIREHAELKTLSITGGYKRLKEEKPGMLIMLCGCMAQQEHVRKKLYNSYPYVDAVFGTDMNYRLPEIIQKALGSKKRLSFVSDLKHNEFGVIAEDTPVERLSKYKAWVSIMYGCDNYCTYCVVPYVRGRERSRSADEIFKEVKQLIADGYKDITLLGQNVNSYKGEYTFPELLKEISTFDGDFILRFTTSHPKDASKELVDVMASSDKIAKHFHLPVQSGNNQVLERMNRRYTRDKYLEIANYIKATIPNVALTTDIICGFPGETAEQFEDTVSLVKEVGFDMIYTFVFSPRPGTAAAKMEGQVPHEEKVRRFAYLSDTQNEMALKLNQAYVGQTLRVLSEGDSGRTSSNKIVTFDKPYTEGQFVNVRIISSRPYGLDGEII